MAITKIHPIKGTLKKALDYIMNEKKTDEKLLISSFNVAPETAYLEFEMTREAGREIRGERGKNLAHHLIQSFSPKETTAQEAHAIGQELADKVLGGKFEYVLTTHIDKSHIHNHIIFNATSFVNYNMYNSDKAAYREIRKANDELCRLYNLSIVESKGKGKQYKEWTEDKQGTSWKTKLKAAIDMAIKKAKTFDDFLKLMEQYGYVIKKGKYIAFKASDQERFTRSKTLGEEYTEEKIVQRISEGKKFTKAPAAKKYVGGDKVTIAKSSMHLGYINNIRSKGWRSFNRQSVTLNDIKELAATLNYLSANKIGSSTQLREKISTVQTEFVRTKDTLIVAEKKTKQFGEIMKYIASYQKHESVYKAYQNSLFKSSFISKHESEIQIFEFAERKLKELGIDAKVPLVEILNKYKHIEETQKALSKDYDLLKQSVEKYIESSKVIQKTIIFNHKTKQTPKIGKEKSR